MYGKCVAKRQPCEFTKQRKRGPPSKHAKVEDNSVVGYSAPKTLSINAANLEHYVCLFVISSSFNYYFYSFSYLFIYFFIIIIIDERFN